MNESRLSELLRSPTPADREAEERGWRVVSSAFEERVAESGTPGEPPRRPRRRAALAVACALAVALAAVSPPGQAVAEWVGDAIRPGAEDAEPALTSLPTDGRLLVNSASGPWVVQRDGSKRLLGSYDEAAWSPGGLFVVAARDRELLALEPGGAVRWSLARPAPISRPAWSPSGFRIAYLTGAELRVVAGDGTGDRRLVPVAARTQPAWRPGSRHVLAFVDAAGQIRSVATDSRRELWRSDARVTPIALAWTPDSRRLLALTPRSLRVFAENGDLLRSIDMPPGARATGLAVHPAGRRAAVVLEGRAGSRVESIAIERRVPNRRLFTGAGRLGDVAWSPGGRWLLVTWRDADQWLFVRQGRRPKLEAVSRVTEQFSSGNHRSAGFPGVGGWCCPGR